MRNVLRHINMPNALIISALALTVITAAIPSVAFKNVGFQGQSNTLKGVVAR